jgi:hypothetical protein
MIRSYHRHPVDSADASRRATWLLLIHQTPPKPDYLRVKIRRRLQRIGAVAIKNSVYALPAGEQSVEDFQWVLREIVEVGGKGSICEASFVDGLSAADVEAMFQLARNDDYREIADEAAALAPAAASEEALAQRRGELQGSVARLMRRLEDVAAIDFCGAAERARAEQMVRELDSRLHRGTSPLQQEVPTVDKRPRGGTWVTRQGVRVDRIASAWLIRRFIDPKATFRFVLEREHQPRSGEMRFDMYEGEFTHQGDRCTFEVLIERFGLQERGLAPIAEIIHDLDLKDAKYGRSETPGVERMIAGIVAAHARDDDRITRGSAFLDDLLASFRTDPTQGGSR